MPTLRQLRRLARLRIFANTLYYGFSNLTDFSSTDEVHAPKQYELIAPCIEDGGSQKARAIEKDVSRKTISRLVEKFMTGGIDALRRKARKDKGQHRVSENTFKFIKGKIRILTNS